MARINFLELSKEKNPTINYKEEVDKDYMIVSESIVKEILTKGCVRIINENLEFDNLFQISSVGYYENNVSSITSISPDVYFRLIFTGTEWHLYISETF